MGDDYQVDVNSMFEAMPNLSEMSQHLVSTFAEKAAQEALYTARRGSQRLIGCAIPFKSHDFAPNSTGLKEWTGFQTNDSGNNYDWRLALGKINVGVTGFLTFKEDPKYYEVAYSVHIRDRYNFDDGPLDIGPGELHAVGLAQEYNVYGIDTSLKYCQVGSWCGGAYHDDG